MPPASTGGQQLSTLDARDQITIGEPAVSTDQPKSHRPDIDGLRAIAVTLVVLFHAGLPFLPGGFVGVDVFFVISGFLITGLLVREAQGRHKISITNFYARRVRRLLPLATLVLVSTVIASAIFLPLAQHGKAGTQINSAAMFFSNWLFAATSADYWAGGVGQSPVLHFWSLSIEEQYYVVIPLLLITALLFAKRSGRFSISRIATSLLLVIGIGSLALSILTSASAGPWAYFGLQTRAWELAVGGLLALSVTRLAAMSATVSRVLMWGGLVAIGFSALWISEAMPYPGSVALIPVLGTAAVLAGGSAREATVPGWLAARPTQIIGLNSYAWYLWHWPILIFVGVVCGAVTEEDSASPVSGVNPFIVTVAVLASLAIALITTRWIERPFRTSPWLAARSRVTLLIGLAMISVTVVSSLIMLQRPVPKLELPPAPNLVTSATVESPAALRPGEKVTLTEDPLEAADEKVKLAKGCWDDVKLVPLDQCNIGAPNGTKTIVLVGDSHARMWAAGMGEAARQNNWKLYAEAAPSCKILINGESCSGLHESFIRDIKALPNVDLILIGRYAHALENDGDDRIAAMADPISQTLSELGASLAAKTYILRDVPTARGEVPACILDNVDDPTKCNFPKRITDGAMTGAEQAAIERSGMPVRHLSLNDLVCPTDVCAAVDRNGSITYRDNSHIGTRFSLSLWKALEAELKKVL